ncbi:MAG TPA: kelch repeat-containing protein [Opitutaceae bacterium]|nr:kelch repeat-containing protein [Opitutaceae bacterium]
MHSIRFVSVSLLCAIAPAFVAAAPSAWKTVAALPRGCAFSSGKPELIGRQIFVVAGRDYRIDQLFRYDLDADAWTAQPTALLTSRHHFATAVLDGRLYVVGGCLGESDAVPHRRTNAAERYDPATNLWTPLAPMLTAREGFQLVAWNGELFAIGGTDREDTPITSVEAYDPATDAWRRAATAPWHQSLTEFAAVAHRDKIIILGRTKNGAVFVEYDPRANTFVAKPPGRAAEKRSYGIALVGDMLLLVGGAGKQPIDTVTGCDLDTGQWHDFPALPQARGGPGAIAVGGHVLCLGGWGPEWDWAHPNASVFALDLPTRSATAESEGSR